MTSVLKFIIYLSLIAFTSAVLLEQSNTHTMRMLHTHKSESEGIPWPGPQPKNLSHWPARWTESPFRAHLRRAGFLLSQFTDPLFPEWNVLWQRFHSALLVMSHVRLDRVEIGESWHRTGRQGDLDSHGVIMGSFTAFLCLFTSKLSKIMSELVVLSCFPVSPIPLRTEK